MVMHCLDLRACMCLFHVCSTVLDHELLAPVCLMTLHELFIYPPAWCNMPCLYIPCCCNAFCSWVCMTMHGF